MKNKSILLFEYSWRNIDFITDNISGTMQINKILMKEYLPYYHIYYCVPHDVNVNLDNDLKNVNIIHIDNNFINIIKTIPNIQLIINTNYNFHSIVKEIYSMDNNIKCLFFKHLYNNGTFNEDIYNLYHKIITVINDITDINNDNKIEFILNPYNPLYDNIDLHNIQKDHSVIIDYGDSRTSSNWDYLCNEIYQKLKNIIPDIKFKFCFPTYDGICIDFTKYPDFKSFGSLSEKNVKLQLLQTPVVFRIYDCWEACPISNLNELLCGTFIISTFKDGMKNNVTEKFYNKYSCKNKSTDEIVELMADVILNYDKYINDLIYEQQYIYNNRSIKQTLPKYKKIIDSLLY